MNRNFLLMICVLIELFIFGCQAPQMCPQADEFRKQGKLGQAVGACEECLKASMSKEKQRQIQKKMDGLKTEITSKAIEEADSVFKGGQTVTDCENAIRALNAEKQKQYDTGNRITTRLAEYRGQLGNLQKQRDKLLGTAQQQEAKNQWAEAVQSVNKALQLDPGNNNIAARLAKIIGERNGYYEQWIKKECREEDPLEADKALESFKQERPAPADSVVKPLEALVKKTMEKVVRSKVEQFIAAKKYFTAYTLIRETGVESCKDLLKTIQLGGSEFYKNLAREEKSKVNDFRAYIAAIKAKILSPNDNEIFVLHQDMTDIVDDSIQVKIGIAEFGAPPVESGAGREFTGMLISHLEKQLPYGVKIDEPEKTRFITEGDIPRLGQKLGIFGDVSTLEVSPIRSVYELKNSVPVTVGEEEIPNPDYNQQCEEMRARYGRDRTKWPPPRPSKTITRPRIQIVDYMSGKKRIEGKMVVSLRLYSAKLNASIGSETFLVQCEFADTWQEGVPAAGIQPDPLELPSELQMKQDLKKDMVEKTLKWILERDLNLNLGFFQERQKHYYKEAENSIRRREYNDAIKVLAQGYLYCLQEKIPESDEWFQKIRQMTLYDLTE